MPIGLGVLAFWRDGTAELARELRAVDTLEPPVTQERRGGAISATDSCAAGVYGEFMRWACGHQGHVTTSKKSCCLSTTRLGLIMLANGGEQYPCPAWFP
jgi:hypothetical protein